MPCATRAFLFLIDTESESVMLDEATKAQLKSYLERATAPIEIVASLDDSQASGELRSLLKDVTPKPIPKFLIWQPSTKDRKSVV